MSSTVAIIGGDGRELELLVKDLGMKPASIQPDVLTTTRPMGMPDAVLLDVRTDRNNLALVSLIKRRFPSTAIALIAKAFEPELMLEAMRAGVTEVAVEPLTADTLRSSLDRLIVPKVTPTVDTHLVAVIGAKGGVGATTVAVNLAEALARSRRETLLIDLHVGTGDTAVFLGVAPRFTVIEALENTHRLDAAFLSGLLTKTKSGLDLLAASTRVPGSIDPQHVRTLLEFVHSFKPFVILDVPRRDLALLESLDSTTAIFVVVNQELPTVKNAQPLVKRLQQRYGDRVKVIVNRSDRSSEISLEDIAKAVSVPIEHVLPNDYRQAMSAANKGVPVASTSQGRLAEAFYAMAKSLEGKATATTGTETAEDTGRLFGWLSARK
ncbi:MAG: AAA family ATPase [Vicinamibacterales bacterium]